MPLHRRKACDTLQLKYEWILLGSHENEKLLNITGFGKQNLNERNVHHEEAVTEESGKPGQCKT